MVSYPRLSKLYEIAMDLRDQRIGGSFVECGVWNGGSAGVVAAVMKDDLDRHIWLFDSWEGLPQPTEVDITYSNVRGEAGMCLGSEEKVKELLFGKLGLQARKVSMVKGWFDDTIPIQKGHIGPIALLHLDCDWYRSVKLCLEELYDKVVQGGVVVIDDYGTWQGCKMAVDEFIRRNELNIKLTKVDYTAVYFQK
jgi:hypothetical protein